MVKVEYKTAMETPAAPAVVLLSGGLDSATALAIARARGRACHALSFRYGQRHAVELTAAAAVARQLGVQSHRVVDVDLRAFGGSALTADIAVPKGRTEEQMGGGVGAGVPVTYVPARNTLFVAFALALAETVAAQEIVLGINVLDASGYPDCRPEWLAAMQEVARLGTRVGVEGQAIRLWAPLIQMSKAEIIRTGAALGVDYGLTHSCYDPVVTQAGALACGACDSCQLRRRGFQDAGLPDPTRYV
jgi:7-cyano-7-deazaguanine synthase